ncbi:MAG: RluA family pseudouridine synthase [bacterium]|jgi:tRNA pseudouridine32 synthase/23S rRNA pseudouridine746 synthase|nr:RluA family pseudouridine synthase [Gammaproteobacteria bacterium]HIL85248.1 RluA family pseudouridine synthase [Pseudomonadales bacterium]
MMIELTDLAVSTETYATDFLAQETGLSKSKIKTTMTRGAVWLKSGSSVKRLRRAKAKLVPGDLVSIYYSPKVLEAVPAKAILVDDQSSFSVWEKPVGLMSGGSRFGDHCSINRVVEQQLDRPTFLVHRLDRYVWGLMVLAHSKSAAAHLAGQFQDRKTTKIYHAIVHGKLLEERVINTPVDNKMASSTVKPISLDADTSLIEVRIETGRKHQIRQHLASIDHPVVGDRQYGSQDMKGIQLAAVELGFKSPLSGEWQSYALADNKRPAFRPQEAK